MKGKLTSKTRKEIRTKMATALGERIGSLSIGAQEILLDDLVTAFENRLSVLRRVTGIQTEAAQFVELATV
jgi:hypothetical protein